MRNERLVRAAIAALQGAGGELPLVSLNKAMFCFDLAVLRDFGRTYTGATYVAFPKGPVVDSESLVEGLEACGCVQLRDGDETRVVLQQAAVAPGVTDPASPEEQALKAAQTVGRWAASQSHADMSDRSHQNEGWIVAFAEGQGNRINMVLAMQQVIDDDPWMDEPLTPEELASIGRAEHDEGEPL